MAKEKWTEADMPDQSGRVCVVTGANSGLGLETALALAAHGASVVLAVRNLDKGAEAIAHIRRRAPHADLHLQRLDLSSLEPDDPRTSCRVHANQTHRTRGRWALRLSPGGSTDGVCHRAAPL